MGTRRIVCERFLLGWGLWGMMILSRDTHKKNCPDNGATVTVEIDTPYWGEASVTRASRQYFKRYTSQERPPPRFISFSPVLTLPFVVYEKHLSWGTSSTPIHAYPRKSAMSFPFQRTGSSYMHHVYHFLCVPFPFLAFLCLYTPVTDLSNLSLYT